MQTRDLLSKYPVFGVDLYPAPQALGDDLIAIFEQTVSNLGGGQTLTDGDMDDILNNWIDPLQFQIGATFQGLHIIKKDLANGTPLWTVKLRELFIDTIKVYKALVKLPYNDLVNLAMNNNSNFELNRMTDNPEQVASFDENIDNGTQQDFQFQKEASATNSVAKSGNTYNLVRKIMKDMLGLGYDRGIRELTPLFDGMVERDDCNDVGFYPFEWNG